MYRSLRALCRLLSSRNRGGRLAILAGAGALQDHPSPP
jgi:hypothetical protein